MFKLCAELCSKKCLCYTFIVTTTIVLIILITTYRRPDESSNESPSRIYIFGGYPRTARKALETYYPGATQQNLLNNDAMPIGLEDHVAEKVANRIALAGGKTDSMKKNSSTFYFPSENRWSSGPSLNKERVWPASAVIHDVMYVCSGAIPRNNFPTFTYDDTCEFLDIPSNRWILLPSKMHTGRGEARAIGDGDYLYIVGGINQNTVLNSLERLDTRTGVWDRLAPLSEPRWLFGFAALPQGFVACGGTGTGGRGRLQSCELYDVGSNRWNRFPYLTEERTDLAMLNFNGMLMVLGGRVTKGKIVDTVEVYDNEWRKSEDRLMIPRDDFAAVVV